MIRILQSIDESILLLFNGHHTPLMDIIMWEVSDRWFWIPFYVIILLMIIHRFGWKEALVTFSFIAVVIASTDQLCASIIRPMVERLRPSNPGNPFSAMLTLVNDYHGGRYGFPSCHAANTMALATFIAMLFRSEKIAAGMTAWSVLVSISRLYLGVHYPSDVLAGWIVGGSLAMTAFYVRRLSFSHRFKVCRYVM